MTRSRARRSWWRRWFGREGKAERARWATFDEESRSTDQAGPSAGVVSVNVLVIDNALRVERRYRRPLLRGENAVTEAATKDAVLLGAAQITESDATRDTRKHDALRREQERLEMRVDVTSSAVSPRYALLLEIVVPIIEIAFWISTWMQEVDRREPWYGPGRVTAVLLAFAIPMLGVVCARFGGRLSHRVVKNYEGIDRADRIGAAVGLVLALTAIITTGWLVYWRYDFTSSLPGGIDVPPTVMALIFSLMLLVIVAVRTFGVSELSEERLERAVHVRRERQADTKRQGKLQHAALEHTRAWLALCGTVNECLNEVEHIYNRGGLLVLDHWAGLPKQPALQVSQSDEDTHTRSSEGGYAVPSSGPRGALPPEFQHPRSLRFVRTAIDVLDRHQPRSLIGTKQTVDDLRKTVRRLTGAPDVVGSPDADDLLPRNGQAPTR